MVTDCMLTGHVDASSGLLLCMLGTLAAPGQRKRLQEHACLGRLLAGQVAGAATPHQRKLQHDDFRGVPCTYGARTALCFTLEVSLHFQEGDL